RLRHADVDRGAVHVPRLTSRARWAVHVARTRGDAAAIETEPVLALVVHGAGLARASRSHRSATQLLDAHRAPEHTHQPAATVAVGAAVELTHVAAVDVDAIARVAEIDIDVVGLAGGVITAVGK